MRRRLVIVIGTCAVLATLSSAAVATDFSTMRRCGWRGNSNLLEATASVSCPTAVHVAGEITYAPYRRHEPYVFDRWSCFRAGARRFPLIYMCFRDWHADGRSQGAIWITQVGE